jgi:hypothetical protein
MTPAALESTAWPDGLIQLLDEHHVAVLCDDANHRRRAGRSLQQHLFNLADSRVIDIDCTHATDLPTFCQQLEPHFPDRPITPSPWWRDVNNVIDLLRSSGAGTRAGGSIREILETPKDRGEIDIEILGHAPVAPSRPSVTLKREYFLWHEAEALLEHDVELFSALVNAFFGVAAEREHISADRLLIQRVVFLGGAKLGAYAEDSNGQFCKWLEEDQGSPFWEVVNVVERPAVIAYRVEG